MIIKRLQRKGRWKLRLALWGFAVMIMAGVLGCGNDTTPRNVKTYGHDGYMGASNSNPNLPNRYSYLNIGTDSRMVRQVLEPVQGIRRVRTNINGEDLVVRLTFDPGLSESDRLALEQKAQSIVQYNMPRYHVRVVAE